MPPTKKFTKEEIIEVAYNIVKEEGLDNLNARRVAESLGSSVQPIFHNFSSMDDLESHVLQKIYLKYKEYLLSGKGELDAYKKMGISYIRFASDYPIFFKILFMQETSLDAVEFIMDDAIGDEVIKIGQTMTGLSYEKQKEFHERVWIFTHGIACLVATNTVKFTEKEIEELLTKTVRCMLIGYLQEEKENL